ncbi:MAG: hypothetical protein ACOX4P_01030 [Anaerovoracaceae bacterium]|jgi:hypothetical protein
MQKTKNKRSDWSADEYMSGTDSKRDQKDPSSRQTKTQAKQGYKADQCKDKADY